MIARLVRVLMLSAAVLAGGPLVVSGDTRAFAAAQNAPFKLTAAQMLGRQQVAVAVIAKSYTALPKEARGRSAPFLKGLIDVANAHTLRIVGAAAREEVRRPVAVVVPVSDSAPPPPVRHRRRRDRLAALLGATWGSA